MSASHPNPEDVHPEYDYPTPENEDEWSEEQLEQYNEAKAAELEAEARENIADYSAETEEAIEELAALADDSDHSNVETVTLGEGRAETVIIDVRTTISGRAEQTLASIDRHGNDVEAAIEDLLDVLCGQEDGPMRGLIVGPEKFRDRAAWKSVWDLWGSAFLLEQLEKLAEPARRNLDSFRED